jgi:chaperonin GroES
MQFLSLNKNITINEDVAKAPNLCNRFDDADRTTIGQLVWDGYQRDRQSRMKWERRSEAGMNLAMQIQQDKNFPWPQCSNIIFPLITIASLQFSARAYPAIIQGTDVVRYRVIGEDPQGMLREKAKRIASHMSWQVLEEDAAWEEQHDRLLINLAIVGTNFVKSYFSPSLGHNVSELVMARDLIIDYYAKSVEAAARKTHVVPLYRNEIYERCMSGVFCDVRDESWFNSAPSPTVEEPNNKHDNRQGIVQPQSDEDTPFKTLEQHRLLDLDGDGYAEPYIATIEEGSHNLLRLVARWESEEDVMRNENRKIIRIKPTEYFTKYSFIPAPDGGIYDVGFGVLIGPLNEGVNTGINQMFDAGTMQTTGGGFLGRGAKIRGGVYTFAPYEWKRVDSTGDDLRKSIVEKPEVEPSGVMYQLIELLIQYTDRLAGTVDQMVGENPGQNTPAETSRNTTEQGMQVFSMIFKRVWRSMKEEFKKLHQLNGRYLPIKQIYGTKGAFALREDYKDNADQVVPVADPNIVSKATRMMLAGAIRTAAMQVPGYDVQEVERNFLRAMGVEEVDKFYPGADKVPPLPNPKMAVENLKLQAKQMDLQYKKWELVTQLQADQKKSLAEIRKLEAETIALLAGVQSEHAALQLKAYESVISALHEHVGMLNERMQELSGGEGEDKSNGAGIQDMEGGAAHAGAIPVSANGAGGAQGAMGGGSLQ